MVIVPLNLANRSEESQAREGPRRSMELLLGNTEEAMESKDVYTKQQQIARDARDLPQVSFTSLAYHMDVAWLKEAYQRTRKDGAVGVGEQTAQQYAENLEGNLQDLLERAKSGTYRAPPVRRVWIPKGTKNGEKRPIGIPTFEDKVLQRAVQMVLEPLYEQEFMECSYGFRPCRSAHTALEALRNTVMRLDGGWVLEVDIRKYYDSLKHHHLHELIKRKVSDGVIVRLIGKWLKAGVHEAGAVYYPGEGTPQGGVISPLLSNIYLHYVLDKWFVEEIEPRMLGQAKLIRFADDFVMVFANKLDADRVQRVLAKRFSRYGLTLHPEKTRLVEFRNRNRGKRTTFDFLGFTHYWDVSRKGSRVVKRKTAKNRLSRSLRKINKWCRENRHELVEEQWKTLRRKVLGHYGYYGIRCNGRSLENFYHQVQRNWRKWLNRRNREKNMTWDRFNKLLERYSLPPPKIVHGMPTLAKP